MSLNYAPTERPQPNGGADRPASTMGLMDAGEIARMLLLLDPEADSFIFFSAGEAGAKSTQRPQHRAGALDPKMIAWMQARQRAGCGIFVTVNAMRGKRRRNDDIETIRAVWIEWDRRDTPLPTFPIAPSMIVESSPGRFHVYWLVEAAQPLYPGAFKGVMRCLVSVYGGDPQAADLARVLRVAGSWNTKRAPQHLVRITEASGYRYAGEALARAFPAPSVAEPKPVPPRPPPRPTDAMAKRHRAYCMKGLRPDVESLACMRKPGRNRALFEAAARWGKYVHRAIISAAELETPLLGACDANGLTLEEGRKDCAATIARGIEMARGDMLEDLPQRDDLRGQRASARIDEPNVPDVVADEVQPSPPGIDDDFDRTAGGAIEKTEGNIRRALALAGIALSYDAFARQRIIRGLVGHGPDLTDAAIDTMWIKFERAHRVRFSREHFNAVIRVEAHAGSYHPVRDYLAALTWDGTPRLDRWLTTYAGAAESELNAQFARLTLIAAVRRVRQPGAKFDAMLVLEGPEGKNKSTLFETLASPQWFSDDAPLNADARETIERLRGKWIIEAADLSAVKRTDVERLKAFLSRSKDTATLKFERETTTAQRECIFVGTTNSSEYLQSTTGNRRFWPVKIGTIDLAAVQRDRDQLWAEAARQEAGGASIMLPEAFWDIAADEQEKRRETDMWEGAIRAFLDEQRLAPKPWVSPADVAHKVLGVPLKDLDGPTQRRLYEAMRLAGWSKENGKTVRGTRLWGPTN